MSAKTLIATFEVPAGLPGLILEIPCKTFLLVTASEAVNFQLDDSNGEIAEAINVTGGIKKSGDIQKIRIWSVSGGACTAEIALASDPSIDINVISGAVTITGGVSIDSAANPVTSPDKAANPGVATLLHAATAGRKTIMISSLPTNNAAGARVGDANVAAGQGQPIQPGGTVTLDTAGDVYVFSANADTFTVTELI